MQTLKNSHKVSIRKAESFDKFTEIRESNGDLYLIVREQYMSGSSFTISITTKGTSKGMQTRILAWKQVRRDLPDLQKLSKEMKFTAAGSVIIWSHNEKAVPKINGIYKAVLP